GESGSEECVWALETLFSVLFSMCRLMAPFTPFITEMMYQNLRHLIDPASVEEKDASSIHYLMLPHVRYDLLLTQTSPVSTFNTFYSSAVIMNAQNEAGFRKRRAPNTLSSYEAAAAAAQWEQHYYLFRESLIDKRIESAVSQMQSVIELGRVIRDRKTLPVK
ncbi:hypothetical protein WMY93_034348, partial [Mugilogobius chulae]